MPGPVKLVSLMRPPGPAPEWQAFIAELATTGLAGLERLVFNTVLPIDARTGMAAPPRFAGVVEAWFADRAAADAMAQSIRAHGDCVNLFVKPLLIHDRGRRPLPGKIMVTLKRRNGMSREAAQRHWRTRHVEVGMVEHNAGDFLQLYFQNHVIFSDQPEGSACDFDGMPEFWVDPADMAEIGEDSPVMRAIAEDEAHFADRAGITTMLVTEHELFVAPGVASGWPVQQSPLQAVLASP